MGFLHYPMAFSGALDLIMGMRGRDRRAVTMVGLSGTDLTDNMVRQVTERILMLPDKPTSQAREKLELLRVRPLKTLFYLGCRRDLCPLLQMAISPPTLAELRAACDYRQVELCVTTEAILAMGSFRTGPP